MATRNHLTRNTGSKSKTTALLHRAQELGRENAKIRQERENAEKEITALKSKIDRLKTKEKESYDRWKVAWKRYEESTRAYHDRYYKVSNKNRDLPMFKRF